MLLLLQVGHLEGDIVKYLFEVCLVDVVRLRRSFDEVFDIHWLLDVLLVFFLLFLALDFGFGTAEHFAVVL